MNFRNKSTFSYQHLFEILIYILFISKDKYCIISYTYYPQHHQLGWRLDICWSASSIYYCIKKHIASIIQRIIFNNIFLAQKWWSEFIFADLRETWFKKAFQANVSALLKMQKMRMQLPLQPLRLFSISLTPLWIFYWNVLITINKIYIVGKNIGSSHCRIYEFYIRKTFF